MSKTKKNKTLTKDFLDVLPFIKSPKLLLETYKQDQLVGYEEEKKRLTRILNRASNRFVCLIGKAGIGKSTLLYNIASQLTDTKTIYFHAWKYSSHIGLWEGFLWELLKGTRELSSDQVARQFLGMSTKLRSRLVDSSELLGPFKGIAQAIIKEYGTPLTYLSQLEAFFLGLLSSLEEGAYLIIIEDIDRVGDAGIQFLQTLRAYQQEYSELFKNITVVFTFTDLAFRKYHLELEKLIDILFHISADEVIIKFLEQVFDYESLIEFLDNKAQELDGSFTLAGAQQNVEKEAIPSTISGYFADLFKILFLKFSEQMTIRMMKTILRQFLEKMISLLEDGFIPDPRLLLLMSAAEFLHDDRGKLYISYFRREYVSSLDKYTRRDRILQSQIKPLSVSTTDNFFAQLLVATVNLLAEKNLLDMFDRLEQPANLTFRYHGKVPTVFIDSLENNKHAVQVYCSDDDDFAKCLKIDRRYI